MGSVSRCNRERYQKEKPSTFNRQTMKRTKTGENCFQPVTCLLGDSQGNKAALSSSAIERFPCFDGGRVGTEIEGGSRRIRLLFHGIRGLKGEILDGCLHARFLALNTVTRRGLLDDALGFPRFSPQLRLFPELIVLNHEIHFLLEGLSNPITTEGRLDHGSSHVLKGGEKGRIRDVSLSGFMLCVTSLTSLKYQIRTDDMPTYLSLKNLTNGPFCQSYAQISRVLKSQLVGDGRTTDGPKNVRTHPFTKV